MIETIWPLSNYPCTSNGIPVDRQAKTVSGLRTYVQELLRRSRTSYSTLQVALYYLVLIQCCLPKQDFTKEQTRETHARISLQCGRRMFLSALILAGKYLQDKTYSARAWSKISGLSCDEINRNEKGFLEAVGWQLHVPEATFHRWTDIVFKYSPAQSPASPRPKPLPPNTWKSLIPRLTAKLDTVGLDIDSVDNDSGYESSSSKESCSATSPTPASTSKSTLSTSPVYTGLGALPETLEPTPYEYISIVAPPPPPPPAVPSLGYLPTPVLTPANCNISTPAVSAYSSCSRKSSMSLAMGEVRRSSLARSILDRVDSLPADTIRHQAVRRSSLLHQSTAISPTSAPSNPSSYPRMNPRPSSLAPSSRAAKGPCLAKPAARRCETTNSRDSSKSNQDFVRPMPTKRATTFPMTLCINKILPADMSQEKLSGHFDRGDASCEPAERAVGCLDPEVLAFLDTKAKQRRAAESQRLQSQRATSFHGSRKRERPLSMDLCTVSPSSLRESIASLSETSSTSTTPRPPQSADNGIIIVNDDHVVRTPNACSSASKAARDSPFDDLLKSTTVKPAKKMQKTQRVKGNLRSKGTPTESTFTFGPDTITLGKPHSNAVPKSLSPQATCGRSCGDEFQMPGVTPIYTGFDNGGSMLGVTR